MFKSLTLKNFKSFGNVTINLCDRHGNPKPIILIYGKNGVGKSNIASAFFFLIESMQTLNYRDTLQEILNKLNSNTTVQRAAENDAGLLNFIKSQFKDFRALIQDNKMIGSKENLSLEFSFVVNNKQGSYLIETNDSEIVHERLEYTLLKNKGIIFEIDTEKHFFSTKAFINKVTTKEFLDLVAKYWGNHSLLSILTHEIGDKVNGYYEGKLSANFLQLLNALQELSVSVNYGSFDQHHLAIDHPNINNLEHGKIKRADEKIITDIGKTISSFFSASLENVVNAFYKKQYNENDIEYELMLTKEIYGQKREIPFRLESSGTQTLLKLLPYVYTSMKGYTSVIDEFDLDLDESLSQGLLNSLSNNLPGQLILTTHTIALMDGALKPEAIYVVEENGNDKQVECILGNINKVNKDSSVRKRYLEKIVKNKTINFNELFGIERNIHDKY